MDRRVTIVALGAGFSAYALASLLWSQSLWGGAQLLSLIGCCVLGTWIDIRRIWRPFILFVGANCLLAWTMQGLSLWDLSYGVFLNQNLYGCAVALALAAALAYDYLLWLAIPFSLAALINCGSRGAVIGAGVAWMIVLWRWFRPAAAFAVIATLALVVLSGTGRDASIASRLGIWHDTMDHFTFFGHGWGGFWDGYWAFPVHTNMTLVRPQHAYNDFVELVFDLGIGTIPLWFLLPYAVESSDAAERLIFFTFLALSLTFFPLYLFPTGQLFALTTGAMLAPQLERTSNGQMGTSPKALPQG